MSRGNAGRADWKRIAVAYDVEAKKKCNTWIRQLLSFASVDLAIDDEVDTRASYLLLRRISSEYFGMPWRSRITQLSETADPEPTSRSVKDLRVEVSALHKQLRDVLDLFFPLISEGHPGINYWPVPARITGIQLVRLPPPHPTNIIRRKAVARSTTSLSDSIQMNYSAGWPDLFWLAVADLLTMYVRQIRRCTECQKLFVKVKRQEYCSAKCSQRRRTRNWREGHEDELTELRHQAYERNIHKFHPNAKVQRRLPKRGRRIGRA